MWRRSQAHPHIGVLRSFPLFDGVEDDHLREFAERAETVTAPEGELLMLERFRGEQFLLVLEGTATVHRGATHIATVGPGDFLGEMGLLQRSDRTATVVARTPMKLLVLGEEGFRDLLRDVPEVGRRIREEAALRVAAENRSEN